MLIDNDCDEDDDGDDYSDDDDDVDVDMWWCRRLDGKKTPEPVFKNPRVSNLFTKWRQVWLMAMERRRKLQDALDRLNEVIVCHVTVNYTVLCYLSWNMFLGCFALKKN